MKAARKVLIRDYVIYQAKLLLDGCKDGFLFALSTGALALDLLGGKERDRLFYRVMRLGERFDLWLNLHGALERLAETEDGLFGASRAGSDNLLGRIEQAVRGGDEPLRGRRR